MMKTRFLMTLGLAALLGACSNGTGPNGNTVSLSIATTARMAPLFSAMGVMNDTVVSGNDTIVITNAQLVMRQIELKRVESAGCQAGPEGDNDSCEEFEIGPMLVTLPLDGTVSTDVTIPVDTGTFDEIDFEVHKVESGADAAFLTTNPGWDGRSILVEGTYNGQRFTYESDLDVEQENVIDPSLVIGAGTTSANVTLRVDLTIWFRDQSGALVDPNTGNKGGQNESIVKENIKKSFKAFEDENRNGDETDES
jgi:hypothetical protein